MADVVLSAELQARVDSFVANLLAAANGADNTDRSVSAMSTNISRNIANVNRQNISAFTNSLNAGTLAVQRFNNTPLNPRPVIVGANRATQSLTDFGRILQDLPYGIQGVANNFNPAIESFQRLQRETGSTSAALRALGGSLLGPAGIGIAISAISSLLIYYTQYQQRANKATKDAKKNTDDYISTLDQLTQVQVKGAENAQKELTDLKILYGVYQNATIPLRDRKRAYSELQEQYPEYFKNLAFEKQASQETVAAYDKLTQSILATARARAAADLITKNSSRQLENEQKVKDLEAERLKIQVKRNIEASKGIDAVTSTTREAAGLSNATKLNSLTGDLNDNLETTNNLKTDSKKLDEANLNLLKAVNAEIAKGAKLPGEDGKGNKNLKAKIEVAKLELPDNPQDLVKKFFNEISGINAPGTLTVKAPENLKIQGELKKVDLGQLFKFDSADLDKAIENLKLQQKLNDIVIGAEQEIIKLTSLPGLIDATAGALSQSFSAMGEAIASGGDVLAAAGGVIQQTFADLLAALGKQFITMGAAKIAAGILASPFGGKLIADGAGLVALGAGLSLGGGIVGGAGKGKASGGVTAFANGGIISGPTLGLMGEYAGAKSDPEVVAPLSKLKNLLGETDDAGNVIAKNRNEPIVLVADTMIRGQDIVTSYRKASGTRNRQG